MHKNNAEIEITILKDGEEKENEELTEALARLLSGKTIQIELSPKITQRLVISVANHLAKPVDLIKIKGSGEASWPGVSMNVPRFKVQIITVP